jgi:hypothetical protein
LRDVRAELARRRLLDFTRWTKPDYKAGRPHRILGKYLDRFAEGSIRRLIISMPPQHGKSELVSRRLPPKLFGRNPDLHVVSCSYAAELAERMSRDVQNVIDSPPYRELYPNVSLPAYGSRTAGRKKRTNALFELDGGAGSYRAAGVGGGITGMPFNVGIIDDYFKNWEEAHSQLIRDNVWQWYTTSFITRQAPDASMLICATRWHSDDLIGRLLDLAAKDPSADQWVVLRLPAIADAGLHPDDDRRSGDLIWPERYGAAFYDAQRAAMGSYLFAGMYQQLPTAEGGNHFKAPWLDRRRYQDGGDYWIVGNGRGGFDRYHKSDCPVFCTVDPAASEKETADHTAIGVWAATPANDLLLLHVVNERLGIDAIVPKLAEVCAEWKPEWVGFEATGFQVALARAARKVPGMPPIRELSHEGKSKLVRATPAIILAEAGGLILPQPTPERPYPWLKGYVDQLCRFTGLDDKEDDLVDMTAYAVRQRTALLTEDDEQKPKAAAREPVQPANDSHAGRSGLWGRRQ